MKPFYKQLVLFPLILISVLIVLVYITSYLVKSRGFSNANTASKTLVMKKREHYDVIFCGVSHARNFSWNNNHDRIERILNKRIFNLGQGNYTCGIEEQFFFQTYFNQEGNSADKLVYFISPPMFYSLKLPVASDTFNMECFSFRFFWRYLKFEGTNKTQRLFEYIKSKLTWEWLSKQPRDVQLMHNVLSEVDLDIVEQGFKKAYDLNESEERFYTSCNVLEKVIEYSKKQKTETIFVIPPAVFGKWPGHENVVMFAEEMGIRNGIRFYDFSESILAPKYYYDYHHLNTNGIEYFMKKYLKLVLR